MQMRIATIAIAAIVLVTGCDRGRIAELEAKVSHLQKQIDDAQSRLGRLEAVRLELREAKSETSQLYRAIDNLKNVALMIEFKDKRTAVLGVQSAVNDVENAAVKLESSIDDAVSAADGSY